MRTNCIIISILFIGCLLFVFVSNTNGQTKEIDSLVKIAETAKEDTNRINAYLSVIPLVMEGEPVRGVKYGKIALELAKPLKDSSWQGTCLQHIGICYDYKGDLDSCLYFLNASNELYRNIKRVDRQAHVISDIAIAYYVRGNYELALRHFLQSLELQRINGDKRYISKTLNNIGLLYKSRKDYANAIRFYSESIGIKEELKDEQGLVNTYMNIGSMYHSQKKNDSALLFAQKCMALAQKLNQVVDVAGAKSNIGEALYALDRLNEAEQAYTEALQLSKESNCHTCLVTIYHGFGNIYVARREFPKAIEFFTSGLQLVKANKRMQQVMSYYEDFSNCYRAMGNYALALKYNDSANEISRQILNEENLRQINEMTAVYETAEKQKQIGLLNAERDLSRAEASQRRRERNYFFLSTILFLALAVVAYRAYTSNKKKKELLNRQNKVIEQSLRDKEILLKEIHHRVKNNLQLVSSLLSLQTDYIKDELALDAVKESRNRVHSMALIHQNLYQEENLTGINVPDYIGKLCDNLFQSYNVRPGKVQLIKEIQPLHLDVEIVVPLGLMLNELITNCLKYAFPNGREGIIKIHLEEDNGQLKLCVYDNGVGFPESVLQKETNTFGFKMIHAFVQKMKGSINMYTEDGARIDIILKNYKPAE